MMPPPSHLTEWVVPDDERIDEESFAGRVQCPCGSQELQLLYLGQTHEYQGEQIPCTAEIDGRFFFLIQALCARCGATHTLLDIDFHGWDGYVCHDAEQAALARPELTEWTCPDCGGSFHTARIGIETQGKEDFIEETNGEFPQERWPDGFSWFDMSIECVKCGRSPETWVSCETM